MTAGQDDVWTLDLFSVQKRRVSCRVLDRINSWEINWNNWFSAGITAWVHKGKIYNPQVGQDSVFTRPCLYFLCFCVCFINTSLLPCSQGWPLTSDLFVFGHLWGWWSGTWGSFCCCKSLCMLNVFDTQLQTQLALFDGRGSLGQFDGSRFRFLKK